MGGLHQSDIEMTSDSSGEKISLTEVVAKSDENLKECPQPADCGAATKDYFSEFDVFKLLPLSSYKDSSFTIITKNSSKSYI